MAKRATHVKAHTRRATFPRVVVAVNFQEKTKKWSRADDKKRRAMKPGKRKSKARKTYYEYRRNRSDLHPATHL